MSHKYVVRIAAITVALMHLYFNSFSTLSELTVSVVHLVSFGALMLIDYESGTHLAKRMFDFTMALVLVAACGYMLWDADNLYLLRGSTLNTLDVILGIAAVFITLELTRRGGGIVIPLLAIIGIGYVVFFGKWLPGVFAFPGLSFDTMMYRIFYSDSGMFGTISRISWTFIFSFLMLGAFLLKSGCGDFIIRLSMVVASRVTGGAGFVAVLGSALMGSISGSSVANTAATGVVTIPLMKKSGFNPYYAAGIESAASTGGQLMPPVMGAGAFIMSSYTQIPYPTIVLYSLLPAVLYYISVFCYVRIEALRSGVTSLQHASQEPNQPNPRQVLLQGKHFIIPFVVLIGLLVSGYTPTYAAAWSMIAVVAASWLSDSPMRLKDIGDALEMGAKSMATLALMLVCIGIPVLVINTTGLGPTFSLMLADWSGGNLFIAITLVALASLIVGMGLPVTASYIVIATIAAPTIYQLMLDVELIEMLTTYGITSDFFAVASLFTNEPLAVGKLLSHIQAQTLIANIPLEMRDLLLSQMIAPQQLLMVLLAAHLIIFWLSQDSNVTPPVCLVAFTAAAIAKTRPMKTGVYAWKLAKALYVVPLIIAYHGLVTGTIDEILITFAYSALGLYAIVITIEGYIESPAGYHVRCMSALCALALLWPHGQPLLQFAGALILVLLVIGSIRKVAKKLPVK